MSTVAVIQARMGSTRLPGKMMFSLGDRPVVQHGVTRASAAAVDEVIVATTKRDADDILARYALRAGAEVSRGSETDVLDRMYDAVRTRDADVVLRLTGDNTLVPPDVMDAVVDRVADGADYAANNLSETFPTGMDAEAFSFESFEQVHDRATSPAEREHVTLHYRTNRSAFDLENVAAVDVFADPDLASRDDLRLTLDVADDYELLRSVYEGVPYNDVLDARKAIRYVDDKDLTALNRHVSQRSPTME